MKKISILALVSAAFLGAADLRAGYDDDRFRREIQDGLDVISAKSYAHTVEDPAYGELGADVYQTRNDINTDDLKLYVPNNMYVRGGVGITLGFLSDKVNIGSEKTDLAGSWATQIGLGWNLSSYVRTEIDFQIHEFAFSEHDDMSASARELGGTLYFDFARRWIRTGDITRRRTIVPFMGLGFGVGAYEFPDTAGLNGTGGMFVAPRGVLGMNIMINDLMGIDIAYQYQMFIGEGFGWNVRRGGVTNLSNLMLSMRYNF